MDSSSQKRWFVAVAATFGLVSALAGLDLVGDLGEGTTVRHALVEGAIVLLGALGLALFLVRYARLRGSERRALEAASGLAADLRDSRLEAERWRSQARELSAGLGELIDEQLGRWGLTAAEQEVALLLLKGLSHKEAAGLRGVSEATVRQQAAAVYRKAGVSGRHDLSAFFLEDLLAPRSAREGARAGPGGGAGARDAAHG